MRTTLSATHCKHKGQRSVGWSQIGPSFSVGVGYLSDNDLRSHHHLIAINIQKVQLSLPQQAEDQRLQTILTHIEHNTVTQTNRTGLSTEVQGVVRSDLLQDLRLIPQAAAQVTAGVHVEILHHHFIDQLLQLTQL